MSTIEDFENAPVGATAAHGGSRAMKMDGAKRYWVLQNGLRLNDKEMAHWDYTLDPFNPEPTAAPENSIDAFAYAWNLGHPVKEGQVIRKGTKWMKKLAGDVQEHTMKRDHTVTANDTYIIRTHEPLTEPEPDWANAPAVLAAVKNTITIGDHRQVLARLPDGRWAGRDGNWETWDLMDVTPLYPKGQDA